MLGIPLTGTALHISWNLKGKNEHSKEKYSYPPSIMRKQSIMSQDAGLEVKEVLC